MTENQKAEYERLKSELKQLKSEVKKKSKSLEIEDLIEFYDLVQKAANTQHYMNHIRYEKLDEACDCGYISPQ
jgi:predicted dinucleotide-utilizing enzyme